MSARRADAVVFDLGGVLVDWDPRRLYRTLLGSDEEIAEFFDEVDFAAWNHALDAGERTWAEAVADHATRFPHRRELLAAYPDRFPETIGGLIDGTVGWSRSCTRAGVRLLALTNWSAELFPHARERFAFLRLFEAVVVSGEERLAKPDPRLFDLLLSRHGLDPAGTVFVDDREVNVEAARAAGMTGVRLHRPGPAAARPGPRGCVGLQAHRLSGAVAYAAPAGQLRRRRMMLTPSRTVSITTSTRSSATTWSLNSRRARVLSSSSSAGGSTSRPLHSTLSARITPSGASLGRTAS